MPKRQWFDIQNKDAAGEIFIYSDIGDSFWGDSVSAGDFKNQLYALKGQVSSVNVRLNSPGGSVFDGVAIYNLLRSFPAAITTQVDGMAASIASIIALAGDKVTMAENAMMMIHDPWMLAMGGADDLRKSADMLDKVKSAILETYVQRSNLDQNTAAKLMAEETWFTAQEAVDAGLAHSISQPVKIAASFRTLKNYRRTPPGLLSSVEPESEEETPPKTEAETTPEDPAETAPEDGWRIKLLRRKLELDL
jgi:ATP-dependent Clp protease protease subunit